jgi:hypothetical protein
VTVGIDNVVGASHGSLRGAKVNLPQANPANG